MIIHNQRSRRPAWRIARQAYLLTVALLVGLLASCSSVETPQVVTLTPGNTPSATTKPSVAPITAKPTPTTSQPTPTIKPTETPTPAGAVTVVILHTSDVLGQMDPCG